MSERQQGMALLEACLLGMVLALMVMAGRWLMQQQYRLQQMQQATHLSLFLHDAQGAPVSLSSSPSPSTVTAGFLELPTSPAPSLQQELLSLSDGFWAVESRFSLPWPQWLRSLTRLTQLQRQSLLWAAAGQAASTQEARRRLESSRTAWAQAMESSRRAAQDTIRVAGPLDAAWGRADVDLDWLGPWQDFSPDHRGRE